MNLLACCRTWASRRSAACRSRFAINNPVDRLPITSAVAAQKFGSTVGESIRPRADRFVLQVTLKIAGKASDRGVPLLRILLQSLADNRVQIATQLALKFFRRSATLFGYGLVAGRCNCARCACRFRLDNRPHQLGWRMWPSTGRMLAGQQQVKQHA